MSLAVTPSPVYLPSALPARDDAKTFLRGFIGQLVHEIRPDAKVPLLLIAVVSGVFYANGKSVGLLSGPSAAYRERLS